MQLKINNEHMKKKSLALILFLKERFNLDHDKDDNQATIIAIEKGIEFKGVNLWTLIFAIFVASIGLNVNSTAVIIGAMLISPLMGPIMGLGLSVGIYDYELLKRSLKNLLIALSISILTSTIYFFISPLNDAKSELLARTTPTIYDVLIALFGGLAGIVAYATKEKGNVIPGVAIATALMPPLCTAGFGLATGNLTFFFGAFYLFFINAVMISLSVVIMVRFLKFPHKQQVNKSQSDRVKRYIYIVVTITIIPSLVFAYRIVRQTIFETNAAYFVKKEFNAENTFILNQTYTYHMTDSNKIELIIGGEIPDTSAISIMKQRMDDYNLKGTKLSIVQGFGTKTPKISNGLIENIYHKNERILSEKEKEIQRLNKQLQNSSIGVQTIDIANEISAINPKVFKISIGKSETYNTTNSISDTIIMIDINPSEKLSETEITQLHNWLTKRLNTNKIKIRTE